MPDDFPDFMLATQLPKFTIYIDDASVVAQQRRKAFRITLSLIFISSLRLGHSLKKLRKPHMGDGRLVIITHNVQYS